MIYCSSQFSLCGLVWKTIDARLNIVFFLLKKNGIKARIPLDEMPEVEEEAAVPYSDDELKKLFSEMANSGAIERVKGKEYTDRDLGQKFGIAFSDSHRKATSRGRSPYPLPSLSC